MLFLLFYTGSDCFALDCESVVEVFPKVSLQKIPGQLNAAPPYIVGLFNYGGKPIPVIDLCMLIEKRPCREAMHSRLILIEGEGVLLALLAEKVTETADLEKARFLESGLKLEGLPFLGSVYNEGNRSIQLFDLSDFFQLIQPSLAISWSN